LSIQNIGRSWRSLMRAWMKMKLLNLEKEIKDYWQVFYVFLSLNFVLNFSYSSDNFVYTILIFEVVFSSFSTYFIFLTSLFSVYFFLIVNSPGANGFHSHSCDLAHNIIMGSLLYFFFFTEYYSVFYYLICCFLHYRWISKVINKYRFHIVNREQKKVIILWIFGLKYKESYK